MMEIVWPNIIGLSRERDVEFFAFATIFHNLYYNFGQFYLHTINVTIIFSIKNPK